MSGKIKPVETLHVLIHPMHQAGALFNRRFILGRDRPDFLRIAPRSSTSSLKRWPQFKERSLNVAEVVERFYRNQIKRIARDKKSRLVIVVNQNRRAPVSPPPTLYDHFASYTPRLVQFAKKRLGNRLSVLEAYPAQLSRLGSTVAQSFSTQVPVNLFGEYKHWCIAEAEKSLKQAGFQVHVQTEKTI